MRLEGLYRRQVFPRLMEAALTAAPVHALRRAALAPAHGKVLEVGFGTGLNISAYPANVEHLVAVDREATELPFVKERIARSAVPIEFHAADGAHLPFANESFDCVVTTWTLCSLDQPEVALAELRRVLKTHGRYLFLEHGLSPNPHVHRWQHLLTPLTRLTGCGCRPNRAIAALIERAGFQIEQSRSEFVPQLGRVSGYLVLGTATR